MNIGLLVSQPDDTKEKRICFGAVRAATELCARLFIFPGGRLSGENTKESFPYGFQKNALFDIALLMELDAVIIDIGSIGSGSAILKKEAFLKKYEEENLVIIGDDTDDTNLGKGEKPKIISPEKAGYEAVYEAAGLIRNDTNINPVEKTDITFSDDEKGIWSNEISDICRRFFLMQYDTENAFRSFTGNAINSGIKNCGILLYDKKQKNTSKYPMEIPKSVICKSAFFDSQPAFDEKDDIELYFSELKEIFSKSRDTAFVFGNLYEGDYQLGLFFSEYNDRLLSESFFDTLQGIITGITRIAVLEKELKDTRVKLIEAQEDLARDDSVLDHIGEEDYLTGLPNRRGFFARAYDLLRENFKPGKYAIVAYIYMESLKRINEIFGHEEGDKAVKKVAEVLDEVFGDSVCGRIRGNEFAVITITDDDGTAESLKGKMSDQNNRILAQTGRYINRLQFSICEFAYDENMSLRDMLRETDENLKMLIGNN